MKGNWHTLAANILRAELKMRGITYEELHKKLQLINITESISGLKVKISRGTFQFSFFLQCAAAVGIKNLRLEEIFSNQEIGTH